MNNIILFCKGSDTLQVVVTAEDVTVSIQKMNYVIGEMIYQFLAHAIEIKRSNLIDRLVTKNFLSSDEKERIKKTEEGWC